MEFLKIFSYCRKLCKIILKNGDIYVIVSWFIYIYDLKTSALFKMVDNAREKKERTLKSVFRIAKD